MATTVWRQNELTGKWTTKEIDNDPVANPRFKGWDYRGNWAQRLIKVGPRKEMYWHISPQEATIMAERAIIDDDYEQTLQFSYDVPVSSPNAAKTITMRQWMQDYAGGNDNALWKMYEQSPWAYRCCQVKAQALSSIPWGVFKGDNQIEKHPLIDLLQDFNPETSWTDNAEFTEIDRNVYGYAVWKKIGKGKAPEFLERLNPQAIELFVDTELKRVNVKVNGTPVDRESIVIFKDYSPRNVAEPVSPTMVAKKAIQTEIYANKHLAAFFENNAIPHYLMTMQSNNETDIKRASRLWHKMYGGVDKQHKTAFVGGGAVPKELQYAPKDLALDEIRENARRDICTAFGVPQSLAGAWEDANYNTADTQFKFLITNVTQPRAKDMQDTINSELVKPSFGDVEFRFMFEEMEVMQEDEESKYKRLSWAVDSGIIKREVAAEKLGFELSDVPEEAPARAVTQTSEAIAPAKAIWEPDETSDLSKWHRKAAKRLKAGKPAKCAFESVTIPDILNNSIYGMLGSAKTEVDVERIFEDAERFAGYP